MQIEVLAVVVASSAGGDLVQQTELDLAIEAGACHAVGEELEQSGEDAAACTGLAGGNLGGQQVGEGVARPLGEDLLQRSAANFGCELAAEKGEAGRVAGG